MTWCIIGFDHLKKEQQFVVGYVIMPNHVHILLSYDSPKTLNSFVGNGKRFIAYEVVERLKQADNKEILETLKSGVNKSDHKKGALHQVFEDSFEAKLCFSKKVYSAKN